ncbi:hypothetical protein C8R45DRAFT_921658 [Mycena sanguinolenta]|nr:hypothetical protein C8R45DRAFT_921658 [Mycena sanguinolenta]
MVDDYREEETASFGGNLLHDRNRHRITSLSDAFERKRALSNLGISPIRSQVMLKSAFVLANVSYALASMTAIPTNCSAYIMQDAQTTRCVTLGAASIFSNYAKIDGLQFAFSSVAAPSLYISYIGVEIPNTGFGLQESLYQQSIGHPEPFGFSLQPAPTANMSI